MSRTWKQKDDAIMDMERRNILGKGFKSSPDQLRDIGYNSVYEKAWLAAADYIEKLEKMIAYQNKRIAALEG